MMKDVFIISWLRDIAAILIQQVWCSSTTLRRIVLLYNLGFSQISCISVSLVMIKRATSAKSSPWSHFNSIQKVNLFLIITITAYYASYPAVITKEVSLCLDNESEFCVLTPTCIKIPPVWSGRQTLVLALPFLPVTTGLKEDLLCPVHPLPSERCVDLLNCYHFRESAFANSITICRTKNNGSVLEMCFYNVTDILNRTRLHFFYSDLHCHSDGTQPQSTRTYVKSVQLLISQSKSCIINNIIFGLLIIVISFLVVFSVTVSDSEICIISNCNQDCRKLFKISIKDKFGCTTDSQNVSSDSCISFTTLQLNADCTPYHVKIEDDNKLIYNGLITGYS